MSSGANRFKHESLEDSKSIVKYLKALQEGFESEALLFCSDNRKLVLNPSGLINLEIEARRKDDDIKLSIRFRWSEETSREAKKQPLDIQPLNKAD